MSRTAVPRPTGTVLFSITGLLGLRCGAGAGQFATEPISEARSPRTGRLLIDATGPVDDPWQALPDLLARLRWTVVDRIVVLGSEDLTTLQNVFPSLAACGETQTLLSAVICGSWCGWIAGGDAGHR